MTAITFLTRNNQPQQKIYLNAFNLLPEIGSATLFKIAEAFDRDFEKAWQAPVGTFKRLGLEPAQLASLENRTKIDPEKEWRKLEKEKARLVTFWDDGFPEPLKHIHTPPATLYIRGELPLNEFHFAIVGTRLLTEYGKHVTPKIASELARAGFVVVSGLATGIDTLAHKAALDAGQPTIAVLGSGLDRSSFFPQQNWNLSLKIAETGAIISEYPLGIRGTKEKFPLRNRIISGLCKGVLVIEADEKSGALITARYALEQNRDVFAVPGSVHWPKSRGTNNLIKQGAKLVTCAKDILEDYNIKSAAAFVRNIAPETKEEKIILDSLNDRQLHIDQIIENSGLDIGKTIATLTTMEMKGLIKNIGNDTYAAK